MDDANLITQAAMSALTTQFSALTTQVDAVRADLTGVASNLNVQLNSAYATMRSQLAAHAALNYNVAHGAITWFNQNYLASSGASAGFQVLKFTIGGVSYFVPASDRADGCCHANVAPPPPQCHGDCSPWPF